MRLLLFVLFLAAAGAAGYYGTVARSSYSAYSKEELALLRHEYERPLKDRNAAEDAQVSDSLVREEERRRLLFPAFLGVAVLAGLGAFLMPAPLARGFKSDSEENARLKAVLGNPAVALEGARQKAAALLGVAPQAPPAVIEAALEAQLKARDMSRLDGLDPALRKVALEQRDALVKARDLLLKKQDPLA